MSVNFINIDNQKNKSGHLLPIGSDEFDSGINKNGNGLKHDVNKLNLTDGISRIINPEYSDSASLAMGVDFEAKIIQPKNSKTGDWYSVTDAKGIAKKDDIIEDRMLSSMYGFKNGSSRKLFVDEYFDSNKVIRITPDNKGLEHTNINISYELSEDKPKESNLHTIKIDLGLIAVDKKRGWSKGPKNETRNSVLAGFERGVYTEKEIIKGTGGRTPNGENKDPKYTPVISTAEGSFDTQGVKNFVSFYYGDNLNVGVCWGHIKNNNNATLSLPIGDDDEHFTYAMEYETTMLHGRSTIKNISYNIYQKPTKHILVNEYLGSLDVVRGVYFDNDTFDSNQVIKKDDDGKVISKPIFNKIKIIKVNVSGGFKAVMQVTDSDGKSYETDLTKGLCYNEPVDFNSIKEQLKYDKDTGLATTKLNYGNGRCLDLIVTNNYNTVQRVENKFIEEKEVPKNYNYDLYQTDIDSYNKVILTDDEFKNDVKTSKVKNKNISYKIDNNAKEQIDVSIFNLKFYVSGATIKHNSKKLLSIPIVNRIKTRSGVKYYGSKGALISDSPLSLETGEEYFDWPSTELTKDNPTVTSCRSELEFITENQSRPKYELTVKNIKKTYVKGKDENVGEISASNDTQTVKYALKKYENDTWSKKFDYKTKGFYNGVEDDDTQRPYIFNSSDAIAYGNIVGVTGEESGNYYPDDPDRLNSSYMKDEYKITLNKDGDLEKTDKTIKTNGPNEILTKVFSKEMTRAIVEYVDEGQVAVNTALIKQIKEDIIDNGITPYMNSLRSALGEQAEYMLGNTVLIKNNIEDLKSINKALIKLFGEDWNTEDDVIDIKGQLGLGITNSTNSYGNRLFGSS